MGIRNGMVSYASPSKMPSHVEFVVYRVTPGVALTGTNSELERGQSPVARVSFRLTTHKKKKCAHPRGKRTTPKHRMTTLYRFAPPRPGTPDNM